MSTPRKVCVIGTHGTGKTTLTYVMAAHYKATGHNVKIVQETARSCPLGINDSMSVESAIWIHNAHVNKELEAEARGFDTIISDRSAVDPLLYAQHFKLEEPYLEQLLSFANHWMDTYERIYYVRPDAPALADGTRATDDAFRTSVDQLFYQYFMEEGKRLLDKTVVLTTTQIFGDQTCWQSHGPSCSSASTEPTSTSTETDGDSSSG